MQINNFKTEQNIVQVLQLVQKKGVYKEILYYKLRKNDGTIVKLPFFGRLVIGSLIYTSL